MSNLASSLINGVLSVEPLAKFIKGQARTRMQKRAETLGVYWRDEVKALQTRRGDAPADSIHPTWEQDLARVTNPNTHYPPYYATLNIHAYDEGNLGWLPAMEVEVAARAVHARLWPEGDERAGLQGDASLRASYHQVLTELLPTAPTHIIDLGCSAGHSSFTLQAAFPAAEVTGVELSPYFLAVAQYQAENHQAENHQAANHQAENHTSTHPDPADIRWVHAAAEDTGLPRASADLVSACLMFHELPTEAACQIMAEAHRLLKPGGHMAIMDMDPQCSTFATMPAYVFTLLKSTEPFLDQYLSLDMSQALQAQGFDEPKIVSNSPRHRTIVARKSLQTGKKKLSRS